MLYWSWLRIVISQSWPGGELRVGRRLHGEQRAPRRRAKRARARAAGQHEAAVLAHARGSCPRSRESRARSARGSGRSRRRARPRDRRASPSTAARHARRDRRLAAQLGARRREPALRAVHAAHRVLDGHELRRRRSVYRARCGRARAGSAPRAPATRCERFSLVETCTVSAARRSAASVSGVSGVARAKFPPMRDEDLRAARRAARWIAATVSRPCSCGGAKRNSAPSRARNSRRGPLPDPHRAVALHVRVAAHRARPRAGPADVAAQEQQVHELLHVRDAVLVLGEPHRPAGDHRLRARVERGQLAHLGARNARAALELVERALGERLAPGLEALRVLGDELAVEHRARRRVLELEQRLRDALQERDVAADPHLHEAVGERRAAAEQARAPPADSRTPRARARAAG